MYSRYNLALLTNINYLLDWQSFRMYLIFVLTILISNYFNISSGKITVCKFLQDYNDDSMESENKFDKQVVLMDSDVENIAKKQNKRKYLIIKYLF